MRQNDPSQSGNNPGKAPYENNRNTHVVHVDEVRPLGRVVEERVILLDETLADGLVRGVERHCRFEVMSVYDRESSGYTWWPCCENYSVGPYRLRARALEPANRACVMCSAGREIKIKEQPSIIYLHGSGNGKAEHKTIGHHRRYTPGAACSRARRFTRASCTPVSLSPTREEKWGKLMVTRERCVPKALARQRT